MALNLIVVSESPCLRYKYCVEIYPPIEFKGKYTSGMQTNEGGNAVKFVKDISRKMYQGQNAVIIRIPDNW